VATVPFPTGPCDWPADLGCCPSWDDLTDGQRSTALSVAGTVLWSATGRQYGLCDATVRPCRVLCPGAELAPWSPQFWPYMLDGQVFNWACDSCKGRCTCAAECELLLPGPVHSVTEVVVDGIPVPPASYRVDGYRKVVRTDGSCFPECQDFGKDVTEQGTFYITYKRGIEPPAGAGYATGLLACEIGKACAGVACQLPRRVTDISRQGVSMTLLDPQEFLTKGLTGIYQVDLWIHAVNPSGRRVPATVWSPDLLPRPSRTTWTP
jgi:hypothetical protein